MGADGDDLQGMSKDELLKALVEEEKRVGAVEQKIREARAAAVEERLRAAQKRTFTEKEQKQIRKAFDTFDKDGSGKIDLAELRKVARELNHEMTEEEAGESMKLLDVNGDGTLDWAEFLNWWGEDSKRGGRKGVKLALMRAKLRAKFLREELSSTAQQRPDASARPQSFTLNTTIGAVDAAFSPASTVQAVVLPATDVVFEEEAKKLLPADFPFTHLDDCDGAMSLRYAVAVDLELRPSATEVDVDQAIAQWKPLLEELQEDQAPRVRFDIRKSGSGSVAEGLSVTVYIFLRMPPRADAAWKMVRGVFCGFEGAKGPDQIMGDIFTAVTSVVQLGDSLGDAVRLDNTGDLLSLLRLARISGHAQLSAQALHLADSIIFTMMRGASFKKEIIRQLVAARLFDTVDARACFGSPDEAFKQCAQGLGVLPAHFAVRNGKLTPELEEESRKLKDYFDGKLRRMFRVGVPVRGLYGMLLAQLMGNCSPMRDLSIATAKVVEGVTLVRVMSPMFSAKVTLSGCHVGRNFPLDDGARDSLVEEAVGVFQTWMEQAECGVSDESTFPATKALLEGCDEEMLAALRCSM
eukprot:TRINITY_DN47405_c0_g1_i1.p1 TRINITY_DN47405_c0_g1~~TRINITY_DN47405_c0_g1_i1.p1  ORF type:complete len:608 (+),score=198.84 TRINITY_DN47405_c0_g1_i1:82-1824(+)